MERDVHDFVPCVRRHIVTFGPGSSRTSYGAAFSTFAAVLKLEATSSSAISHPEPRAQRAETLRKDSPGMVIPTLPDS
jgi:hypothetical protein